MLWLGRTKKTNLDDEDVIQDASELNVSIPGAATARKGRNGSKQVERQHRFRLLGMQLLSK